MKIIKLNWNKRYKMANEAFKQCKIIKSNKELTIEIHNKIFQHKLQIVEN